MFAATAQLIETKFQTDWTAANPSVPIRFKNVPWKQPTSGEWVALTIIPGDGRQDSLGSGKLERQLGIIVVQVFTPKGGGSRRSLTLADSVASVFRYQTLSDANVAVVLRTPMLTNVGERSDAYQDNVRVPFQAERIFS